MRLIGTSGLLGRRRAVPHLRRLPSGPNTSADVRPRRAMVAPLVPHGPVDGLVKFISEAHHFGQINVIRITHAARVSPQHPPKHGDILRQLPLAFWCQTSLDAVFHVRNTATSTTTRQVKDPP